MNFGRKITRMLVVACRSDVAANEGSMTPAAVLGGGSGSSEASLPRAGSASGGFTLIFTPPPRVSNGLSLLTGGATATLVLATAAIVLLSFRASRRPAKAAARHAASLGNGPVIIADTDLMCGQSGESAASLSVQDPLGDPKAAAQERLFGSSSLLQLRGTGVMLLRVRPQLPAPGQDAAIPRSGGLRQPVRDPAAWPAAGAARLRCAAQADWERLRGGR